MRRNEIEMAARRAVERLRQHGKLEDDRIEAKRIWIDAPKAARIIAGHANQARGDWIMWLVGVDEKTGDIHPTTPPDLAEWWPTVKSSFASEPPAMMHLHIDDGQKAFTAVVFETHAAPYLTKNPKGGVPETEVPWREGTSTRTATRANLMSLLAGVEPTLSFETRSASVRRNAEHPGKVEWSAQLQLYVDFAGPGSTYLPFHRASITLFSELGEEIDLSPVRFHAANQPLGSVRQGGHEIEVSGPGVLQVSASRIIEPRPETLSRPDAIRLRCTFSAGNTKAIKVHDCELRISQPWDAAHVLHDWILT